MHRPHRVVVLSGAGLSAASGVPTFRDADGLWEGYEVEQVATPRAWHRDPVLVRRFYDERRLAAARVQPNAGHLALARLQAEWGPDRVVLVTQNIDGLLQKAGATKVIEMHGSLFKLHCERNDGHPWLDVQGAQGDELCVRCKAPMRPAVVWFGEVPREMGDIGFALSQCDTFVSVGTSGLVYPAAGFVGFAHQRGAWCIEVNPKPSSHMFHEAHPEGSETALPRLVDSWLA